MVKTPKEKWDAKVKRWVAARVAKRKAKAKKPRRAEPPKARAPLFTLADLKAMWNKVAPISYQRPATGRRRRGVPHEVKASLAYPRVAKRLASKRRAEKFVAWCHRKGLSLSEGRALLNKRHDARKQKLEASRG